MDDNCVGTRELVYPWIMLLKKQLVLKKKSSWRTGVGFSGQEISFQARTWLFLTVIALLGKLLSEILKNISVMPFRESLKKTDWLAVKYRVEKFLKSSGVFFVFFFFCQILHFSNGHSCQEHSNLKHTVKWENLVVLLQLLMMQLPYLPFILSFSSSTHIYDI